MNNITAAPAPVETSAETVETPAVVASTETVETPAVKSKDKPKKAPNLAGFARKDVPDGSKVFALTVGESDAGVVSYRVFVPTTGKNGEPGLKDVTKALRSVEGIDLPTRGRPRNEVVVRAKAEGRTSAPVVLGRRIAEALHGEDAKVTVQAI